MKFGAISAIDATFVFDRFDVDDDALSDSDVIVTIVLFDSVAYERGRSDKWTEEIYTQ